MKKIKIYLLFLVIFGFLFLKINPAFAHPGRTDASGCHTCRTNCPSWGLSYGEYHCHRAKALPQPVEPIKSHKVESGAGYTTPAPEYKIPKIDNSINPTTSTKLGFWERIRSFFGWH